LPEPAVGRESIFDQARNAVAAWLDGPGQTFANRESSPSGQKMLYSWKLAAFREGVQARLVLPRDFPAKPAQVYVSKDLCLSFPHVEEDGRVCLSVKAQPGDYESPAHAVAEVLRDFQRFLDNSGDPGWVEQEFHNERTAYWLRFCESVRVRQKMNSPRRLRASVENFPLHAEGDLALYRREQPSRRANLALATMGGLDANAVSHRHGWARGTRCQTTHAGHQVHGR
jgi:hypothetical protein